MNYNIHPLFVHFPIALLLVYSVIKILPLSKFFPSVAWKHTERILLVLGVAGAFGALSTGEIARELVRPDHDLVEAHEMFASLSTWIYGLLLAGEALVFLNPRLISKLRISPLTRLTKYLENLLTGKIFSKLLALAGIVAISTTGLLGGVMVYGTSADPLAPIVLNLLGL